jgi:hypothetical protein
VSNIKISVFGGTMNYPAMKKELSEKDYAGGKVSCWIDLIKQNLRPTRWLRPTKNGTKVNFDLISTKNEMSAALDELESYVKTINREHGFDYEINRGEY